MLEQGIPTNIIKMSANQKKNVLIWYLKDWFKITGSSAEWQIFENRKKKQKTMAAILNTPSWD